MAKTDKTVQVPFIGTASNDERAFTLMKFGRSIDLWIETEEGDASATMSRPQFDHMVEEARKLMGWT